MQKLIKVSRLATLPPRVTNNLRNQWRDQGNITTSLIISTQQQDLIRNKKIVKIERQILIDIFGCDINAR